MKLAFKHEYNGKVSMIRKFSGIQFLRYFSAQVTTNGLFTFEASEHRHVLDRHLCAEQSRWQKFREKVRNGAPPCLHQHCRMIPQPIIRTPPKNAKQCIGRESNPGLAEFANQVVFLINGNG